MTKRLLLFPLLLLPLAGCPGPYAQQKMQSDIDGLKAQVDQMQADAKKGATVSDVRQQVADLGAQLEQLKTDISLLQGHMEQLEDAASKKSDDQLKARQDLEIRMAQLEQTVHDLQVKLGQLPGTAPVGTPVAMASAAPSATPLPKSSVPPGTVATPMPTATGQTIKLATPTPAATANPNETDQQIYQRGVEAFDGKRYDDARAAFADLITRYPKSDLADNARFWTGESYYAQKDYASAILEYEKVVKDYPSGDKVPAALLKEGYAFLEIGEKDGGVATLHDLINKFPKSEEAKKARDKLAKLK